MLVSVLNPRSIVISGQLAECGEVLLSGVRERIYQRTAPLATRNLRLSYSDLGESAGVTGLALITIDRVLGTESLPSLVASVSASPAVALAPVEDVGVERLG